MVATSLWSPGPLPAHLHHHHDDATSPSLTLLLSLITLGLPQYCERMTALSAGLTDRLLQACLRCPSPESRRPLLWCAGLLRLMTDKLESKMCYYNANMPNLWAELLQILPARPQDRMLIPTLLGETSDLVCSFGSFLKDVQTFYRGLEAELAALEGFVAMSKRRRRMKKAGFFIIAVVCMAILLITILLIGSGALTLPNRRRAKSGEW